jgi:PHD/YefM family antitoxin component YafN of YafNO toxin-antitoxin module
METFYLLKSPKNTERLLRSLAHALEGKLMEKEVIEES